MADPKEFAERLNKLLDARVYPDLYYGRSTRLAKDVKQSQKAAQRWLSGHNIPKMATLERICEKFGANLQWLMTGEGEMLRDSNSSGASEAKSARNDQTSQPEGVSEKSIASQNTHNDADLLAGLDDYSRSLIFMLIQHLKNKQ